MNAFISYRNVLVLALCLVFIIAFVPYMTKVTDSTLLVAPLALICVSFIITPIIMARKIAYILKSLRRSRILFLVFVLPAAPTLIAVLNGQLSSMLYAILMSVVLAAMQVILVIVSLDGLVVALSLAALVCVPAFIFTSLPGLSEALRSGGRFIPSAAQPNAVAFIFVGFAIACIWQLLRAETQTIVRLMYLVVVIMASSVIFMASSRASMLALGLALLVPFSIYELKLLSAGRAQKYIFVILSIAVVGFVIIFMTLRWETLTRLSGYMMHILAINSRHRGLSSGLSGRLVRWDKTLLAIFSGLTWLVGAGYRTSGSELGFSVDNGYLTLWYESGLLGMFFIVGQMIWLAITSASAIRRGPIRNNLSRFMLLGFVVALLINNIFDRYLFGLGNPFSLFALGTLLINRDDLARIFET